MTTLNKSQRRGVVVTVEVLLGLFPYAFLVALLVTVSFWFWLMATNEIGNMHYAYIGQRDPVVYRRLVGASLGQFAEFYLDPNVNELRESYGRAIRVGSGSGGPVSLWTVVNRMRASARSQIIIREEGFYKDIDQDITQWE